MTAACPPRVRSQSGSCRLTSGEIAAHQDHSRAAPRQRVGGRGPETTGGAGDRRGLVREQCVLHTGVTSGRRQATRRRR